MSEPPGNRADIDLLTEFLNKYPLILFIRLQWLDYCCTLRARVVTAKHFLKGLTTMGRFHEVGRAYLSLPDDSAPLYNEDPSVVVGKNILFPDLSSLRLCPWAKGHASVMCFYSEQYMNPTDTQGLRPIISNLCPRGALRRAMFRAEQLGLKFHVGMELEFVALIKRSDGSLSPIQQSSHQASSIRTLEGKMQPILDEIILILEAMDVFVQHYQSESGDGQFELALCPLPPLLAADAIISTREVIRTVCAKHSMIATVHPSCTTRTSGAHTHISIQDCASKDVEEHFLAGLLDHLGGLCAFGMPVPASYERIVDGECAAGRFLAWGTQNREAAVRKMEAAWWELRIVDGLANIYLFLAAVIVAGCSGVELGSPLKIRDCEVDPASLSREARASLGIEALLPASLPEALQSFKNDSVLYQLLGKDLSKSYSGLMDEYRKLLDRIGSEDPELQKRWLIDRF